MISAHFVPLLTSSSNMYEGSSFRTFSEMSTSLRWVFQKMEMVSGRNSIWLFEALQICCGVKYLGLSSFANKKKINLTQNMVNTWSQHSCMQYAFYVSCDCHCYPSINAPFQLHMYFILNNLVLQKLRCSWNGCKLVIMFDKQYTLLLVLHVAQTLRKVVCVWWRTRGQAQGSGKLLSLFLLMFRELRAFRQCRTEEGSSVRPLSDTSSSCSLRRPIQFVPAAEQQTLDLRRPPL